MKIVLYRDASMLSEEAAAFLRNLNIPFEEVDIRTENGFERLLKRTRQRHVPVFELKRSHNIGIFDWPNRDMLLREIGKIPGEITCEK